MDKLVELKVGKSSPITKIEGDRLESLTIESRVPFETKNQYDLDLSSLQRLNLTFATNRATKWIEFNQKAISEISNLAFDVLHQL